MKVINYSDVPALIRDGSTIALSGASAYCVVADEALKGIEESYIRTGHPNQLVVLHPQGFGNKEDSGISHLAHEGLVKRVIGGHWAMSPKMGRLAQDEKIEAYNLPQGILSHLIRDMAGNGPGVISQIGLDTFIDPRQSGGKMNDSAQEDLVKLITLEEKEYLWYKPIPIDVAILRGTTSDSDGYISFEEESQFNEVLEMAIAAKSNGGIVIVQVKYLAENGCQDVSQVKIPGYLVDYVVVAPEQRQSNAYFYKPSYCGASFEPVALRWPTDSLDVRKFIARRQCLELQPGMLVNIGVGISTGIPTILSEEGCQKQITFSLEQGQSGGLPLMGLDAGAMLNPRIITSHPSQHDLYHGGILDAACLSAAEINFNGDVNVSKLDNQVTGCGGFIDISQETKKIVFGGTFCAKSKVSFKDGKVTVLEQGKIKKFVNTLKQITFSGKRATANRKKVVFITERCVFELREEGLTLVEVAPGIDIERDILNQMEYKPLIAPHLKEMPACLFNEGKMGLSDMWRK